MKIIPIKNRKGEVIDYKLIDIWYATDVIDNTEGRYEREITLAEAQEILKIVIKSHDANIGINWEFFDITSDSFMEDKGVKYS